MMQRKGNNMEKVASTEVAMPSLMLGDDQIKDFLDQKINPSLALHGGGVSLVKVEDNNVYLSMEGGCHGCQSARMTLKNFIERALKENFPQINEVRSC